MYNGSWYIGSILSAWITYATLRTLTGSVWAWRIPSMLQAVPSLLQAVLVWFLPESPRWLVANGHDLEAVKVLTKYHANGRERDPLVYFTYGQIREALSMEREISASTSYLTLFKSPGNRRRMRIVLAIGFFSQWAGNGLVSYYVRLSHVSFTQIHRCSDVSYSDRRRFVGHWRDRPTDPRSHQRFLADMELCGRHQYVPLTPLSRSGADVSPTMISCRPTR